MGFKCLLAYIYNILVENNDFARYLNILSLFKYMKRVIDYGSNDRWQSDGKQDSWWEIKFQKIKVKINGYSIKTHDNSAERGFHLKNWVIEGKNEGA